MRDYLFRGKSLDTGEWVYGQYYKQTEFYGDPLIKHFIIVSTEDLNFDQALEFHEVDPKTVGQYTGKDDVSGVKVFTDDIVEYQMQGPYSGPEYRINKVGPVIFSDYCFMPLTFCIADSVKIIGNIHDNPELHMKK